MVNNNHKAISLAKKVKQYTVTTLMFLMLFIVIASVIELGIMIYKEVLNSRNGSVFFDINELLDLFSFFFLVLIGIELLETIEMYFKSSLIHAEIVLMVAIIAVSRKVILLELSEHEPLAIVGFSLVIAALGLCYFLIKKINKDNA